MFLQSLVVSEFLGVELLHRDPESAAALIPAVAADHAAHPQPRAPGLTTVTQSQ